MNSLLFDFTIDRSTKTVTITREFAAGQSLVWDAFTKPELLDQWWAPQPYTSRTIKMDFRVGGRRFYAMVNQENVDVAWQIFDYTSITPKSNFKFLSVFADKYENLFLPGSNWDLTFSERHGITKVFISIYNDSPQRMEKMIEMNFQGGLTATLKQLEALLSTLKK